MTALITAAGIYPDITPEQYFAGFTPAPALTNSGMQYLLEETPADFAYHHAALNPDPEIRKANLAMRTGDVVHQLALGKGRGYRIADFERWDRRNKDVDRFMTECERDKVTPVKAKEFEPLQKMAKVVSDRIQFALCEIAHSRGIAIPAGGIPWQSEVVFAWQEDTPSGPVWCTGMMDVWCEMLLVVLDPKITGRLINRRVRAHMENMGWDRQGVYYERGLNAIMPEAAGRVTFADIMVKPKPPYTHRTVKIEKAWRSVVEPDIRRCLDLFGLCLAAGKWPGYPEGIEELEPTSWKLKAAQEAALDDEDDEG